MSFHIHSIRKSLSKKELDRFTDIARQYYPESLNIRSRIEQHIKDNAHILIAKENGACLGFSLSSCNVLKTPFYSKKIPLIYQRQMYVDPEALGRKIGIYLQVRVLQDHLGPFWLFRRFALMSITHNPLIVKNFRLYSRYYPNPDELPTPREILEFSETLLNLVGGSHIDDTLRIFGTYKSVLKDVDYSHWWSSFLACGNDEANRLVMNSLFRSENDKVIHTGATLLMLGYAKPFNFVKRFLEIKVK